MGTTGDLPKAPLAGLGRLFLLVAAVRLIWRDPFFRGITTPRWDIRLLRSLKVGDVRNSSLPALFLK